MSEPSGAFAGSRVSCVGERVAEGVDSVERTTDAESWRGGGDGG